MTNEKCMLCIVNYICIMHYLHIHQTGINTTSIQSIIKIINCRVIVYSVTHFY